MKRANETDCAVFREQASAWLDAEAHDAPRLQEHLATCSACRAHTDALRALSARFAAATDVAGSSDLWPRIALRVRAEQRPTRRVALRAAAAVLGCAPTAALLGWLDSGSGAWHASTARDASMMSGASGAGASAHDPWPAALREPSVDLAWRSAPEQRLLAAFDPRAAARRDHENDEGVGNAELREEGREERR